MTRKRKRRDSLKYILTYLDEEGKKKFTRFQHLRGENGARVFARKNKLLLLERFISLQNENGTVLPL